MGDPKFTVSCNYLFPRLLLLWGKGVRAMQVMQIVYGVATSTEIAYYTYIYAKVEPRHFQKVTSFTRVSLLLGRFLSGVLAQALTSAGAMDYRQLNYFTLASVSAATAVSFLLPRVENTRYFHAKDDSPQGEEEESAMIQDGGGDGRKKTKKRGEEAIHFQRG